MIYFDAVDIDATGAVKFVAKFNGCKRVVLHVDPYQYNVRMNKLLQAGEEAYATRRPFTLIFSPLYTCYISMKILNQYETFTEFLVHNQETYRMLRFSTLIVDVMVIKNRKIDMRDAPCITKYVLAKKTKHIYSSAILHNI